MNRGLLSLHARDLYVFQRVLDILSFCYLLISLVGSSLFLSPLAVLFILLFVFSARYTRIYQSFRTKGLISIIRSTTLLWFYSCFLGIGLCILLNVPIRNESSLPPSLLVLFFFLCNHLSIRLLLRKLRSLGYNSRRILLVSGAKSFSSIQQAIKNKAWTGLSISTWFPLPSPSIHSCSNESAIAQSLYTKLSSNSYHFIILDDTALSFPLVLHTVSAFYVPVFYLPSFPHLSMPILTQKDLFSYAVSLWNSRRPFYSSFLKRSFDILLSLILIIILSPLFILLLVVIPLTSPGNPLFIQQRYGYRR